MFLWGKRKKFPNLLNRRWCYQTHISLLFLFQLHFLTANMTRYVTVARPQYSASCISCFGRTLFYSQWPQAPIRSRARPKKRYRTTVERKGVNAKGRCRYAKDAPDDRQFLSSRRHRHRLKIQFEKSNNTAQFAWKCVSRSSSDGIVRRVDTMRPIGGGPPFWIFTTFTVRDFFPLPTVHYRHRPSICLCTFCLLAVLFFHGRRFGCTRARYNRRRVTACPICIPRSKSDRPRWFSICRRRHYLFCTFFACFQRSSPYRRF